MEPQSPMVLLAGARLRHRRGDIEEARRLFDRAIAKLRERGLLGWVPYYERRARARGLVKAE
ncbi:MAG: hypothetical protein HY721_32200 [Planctomycetes bacterium]|nr:hypothetical protein [Planctomycetota bacterium]